MYAFSPEDVRNFPRGTLPQCDAGHSCTAAGLTPIDIPGDAALTRGAYTGGHESHAGRTSQSLGAARLPARRKRH